MRFGIPSIAALRAQGLRHQRASGPAVGLDITGDATATTRRTDDQPIPARPSIGTYGVRIAAIATEVAKPTSASNGQCISPLPPITGDRSVWNRVPRCDGKTAGPMAARGQSIASVASSWPRSAIPPKRHALASASAIKKA
jgi:hypothetical protein